jgi:pyridoxal phosphate-dependent aminotransferase EpsN
MDAIGEVCARYELPILEDAAESLGARYKGRDSGTFGAVSVFSFNGNKTITGTSGGMLCSHNEEWVGRARRWSGQACDPDPERIGNYVHSELGFNYRLSNVLAGIVRGQLEVLEKRIGQRRAVFRRYAEAFADVPGISPQPEAEFGAPGDVASGRTRHTRWLSCFVIDEEKFGIGVPGLIRRLAAEDIEARPVWRPMHTQPLYQGCEVIGGEMAEDLNRRGVCLPSSSSLSEEQQERVVRAVKGMGKS